MQNLKAVCPRSVRAGRIAAHVMDVMEGIVMEYGMFGETDSIKLRA